ncbi:MAG TPA: 2Fe-2S iron-sulfur cluster-binding protein [Steroidobacteraceae bacterium]|nr:2Fe-2S iron-sulfur cluster-binding protein [Steroidobacteraceae bacterium]
MSARGPFRCRAPEAAGDAVRFRFDGVPLSGQAGDTLAAALLANGVRILSRSFKFHRPRGVFSCGVEEPNALVQLGSGARAIPSARATITRLHEGLEAFSQSGWPRLDWDLGRAADWLLPFLAAGFYNKTFKWPGWRRYEGSVRRAAGLGRAPIDADPDGYEVRNLHCDTLVVGGGIAGLQAAMLPPGERVVLVEQDEQFGGCAAWDGSAIDGRPASSWIGAAVARLVGTADVRLLLRSTAVGFYEQGVIAVHERSLRPDGPERADGGPRLPRERLWIVRARRTVLATGAIEQPLIFCNNDRPGVVLAASARQYLRRHGVAVGRRIVLATNNDSAYATAGDLHAAGLAVIGVADSRPEVPGGCRAAMLERSIAVWPGAMPVNTRGFGVLTGVRIGVLSRTGNTLQGGFDLACDALAVSGGWSGQLQLFSQAGGRLVYADTSGALRPECEHPLVRPVGAAADDPPAGAIGRRVAPVGDTRRQWVDLRNDVTVADLELAIRENYTSVEHVKRLTTAGMSVDQGKTSQPAVIEIVARLRGCEPSSLGHPTLRPPYTPVTMGALAGAERGPLYAPARLSPLHEWHASNGAELEDYGPWRRPAHYARPGEARADALARETRAVRTRVGLFDASPLGKIELHGPDARAFLDRLYINDLSKLEPGRSRYGIMLRETGSILDDGTVTVLSPEHCLVTTTSANAARVHAWMEEWHQCEWPHLHLAITPVTEQWATIAVAGGPAREVLRRAGLDIDLSSEAFPHLAVRTAMLRGRPARIHRVSFTGELSYEVNVPAEAGIEAWQALLEAGEDAGIEPVGVEALLRLRLEKGYLHVGTDTDATTVPADVGWGGVCERKRADFVGKRSLTLPENIRADRLQLVGLAGPDGGELPIGGHLRLPGSESPTDGWITSAGRVTLGDGQPIALAMLRGGRQHYGARVSVHDLGRRTTAEVVRPPFFDVEGARLHA